MKCAACNYEQLSDYELSMRDDLPEDFVNGETPFKESCNQMYFQMSSSDYRWNGKEEKTIYACPKCGTLKIDI